MLRAKEEKKRDIERVRERERTKERGREQEYEGRRERESKRMREEERVSERKDREERRRERSLQFGGSINEPYRRGWVEFTLNFEELFLKSQHFGISEFWKYGKTKFFNEDRRTYVLNKT